MTTTFSRETLSQEDGRIFAVSFAQQHAWILDQLDPDRTDNAIVASVCINRALNIEFLEGSINAMVQRHEVLRTTFRMLEGELVQVVVPDLTIMLPVVDLCSLVQREREVKMQQLVAEATQRPFDLGKGPLVRTTLLQLGAEEYLLLLTIHRIICDRRSLGVLSRELATLYEAFSTGTSSPLPELSTQYPDFVNKKRQMLHGDILAEHLAYWKGQLAGIPTSLELPTNRPPLPGPALGKMDYIVTLPMALTNALKDLSQHEGVTLYMTLVAAFQVLLYRYSGQEDVVVGMISEGHMGVETEALIGLFENILVVRTDLSGNPTFRVLLKHVHDAVLEAQKHQEVPFGQLVKELQPERQLDQSPLFQVMLMLVPVLPSTLSSGWTLKQIETINHTSTHNLTLEIVDCPEGLKGHIEYDIDLFDEAVITRMTEHWQTLLEAIVADPEQHLSELPLLKEKELHRLLVEWNTSQTDYLTNQCIHQLFEAQAERTPEAVAVVFEDQRLTYYELNVKANQVAHYLRALGVGPEMLVGLCVERSLNMIVGLLGILKAGGAYVPLDSTYPAERLAFMLKDSQVPILLTQEHLIMKLPKHEAKVISLDADWELIAQESKITPINKTRVENLVYVIYTSGSTGKPKGVLVEHRGLCNLIMAQILAFNVHPNSHVLQFASFSFDASVSEIFMALLSGARLSLGTKESLQPGPALLQLLRDQTITIATLSPSILTAMPAEELPDLHTIIAAGESCSADIVALWSRNRQFFNAYGPTEVTICATISESLKEGQKPVIGRPIANTQIYLLDQYLQLVPIGIPGELYIGGAGITRGYLNRPELTAERFIAHPFSNIPNTRLYKTGDLARYLPNGNIEFLGRLDHQVKLRGLRIELGEIEAVLTEYPAVHHAVVVARTDVPGNTRLVAYVMLYKEQIATIDDLKSHMMRQVPAYMVPSSFILLETLPLTPNGKVDRRALSTPGPSERMTKDTFVAPTMPLHHQLVHIWEDLLGVRAIGIKDDFFELGGNSLLAIRLIDRIAQVCNIKLPLSTLFAGATIEQLVTALMGEVNTNSRTTLVTVQAGGTKRPFFFLHGQWEGGAFYSLELARYLGPDQPFYLLEPYKFDSLTVIPTFEAIAATHIELIRSVQPEGPYLLGGWCNGGLMAYEMAWQLHTQGQMVDLLVLMDPDAPALHKWDRLIIASLGTLLRTHQEKQIDWFLLYRYLRLSFYYWHSNKLKQRKIVKQEGSKLERRKVGDIPPQLNTVIPKNKSLRQEWPLMYDWITSGYMPHSYPGRITFFWTSEEPFRRERWDKLIDANIKANKVENYILPGNHITSRTEHLHVLAERLKMCLYKTQSTL